ncbi:hypothetical protein C9J21_22180 [Photobacterium phosphoreum]|uniref:glycosyltransferase family 8 protein n=1 Tax=Photobacterium phosphoreum TaxID=659 RepID=UPI000D16C98B|nr:glycosyltransferase family 8 protein [Photobacterium phosphoreum]PSW23124.1 hypothetical protein C9J21_22180 [Photobacterium phosphoreum]
MIQIAINIDEKYTDYACVLITSVLKYNKKVTFHILHNGLSAKSKLKLKRNLNNSSNIELYEINSEIFKGMPTTQQWPEAIYYRILVSDLLPNSLDKVIYCDCDVMFRGELSSLWNINIDGYSIGAIEDVLSPISPMLEKIGCNPCNGYFNSGVMLINLVYWRENNISEKALKFIREKIDIITHPDQDALNNVLNNSWLSIHSKWNFLTPFQNLYYDKKHMISDYNKTNEHYPVIVHFSGDKPWTSKCKSIYKFEYLELMKLADIDIELPKNKINDYFEYIILKFLDYFNIRKLKVNYFFNSIKERN